MFSGHFPNFWSTPRHLPVFQASGQPAGSPTPSEATGINNHSHDIACKHWPELTVSVLVETAPAPCHADPTRYHLPWRSALSRSSRPTFNALSDLPDTHATVSHNYHQTIKCSMPLNKTKTRKTIIQQGVALTGRNTTGPPSRAVPPGELCHCRVLQTTTDDDNDERKRASLVWPLTLGRLSLLPSVGR